MRIEDVDLCGEWTLVPVDGLALIPDKYALVKEGTLGHVPGCVHTDLQTAGKIPDPFWGMNECDLQWIDSVTWKYARSFNIPDKSLSADRVELVAEGLDTFAKLILNGLEIFNSDNMFLQYRVEISKLLQPGFNTLEVIFEPAFLKALDFEKKNGVLLMDYCSERGYVRKAQYQFGWDWAPRFVTSGIWRPIRIESHQVARIQSWFAHVVELTEEYALIEAEVSIDRYYSSEISCRLTLSMKGNVIVTVQEKVRSFSMIFHLRLDGPMLWWPVGFGDQSLYDLEVSLHKGVDQIDISTKSVGIRKIRLVQENDNSGMSFIFEINGVRVFCKGANWVPADSFISRPQIESYWSLLMMAKESGVNMLRVWGGGIYESDFFYEACDRLGILVWQDFMFACGEYPEQTSFLESVKSEVEQNVTRLRNHPSIVLWCGNNEDEWTWGIRTGLPYEKMRGAIIGREIIPDILNQLDSSRPYWRSSPFGQGDPNSSQNGDFHAWDVWLRWKDFRDYQQMNPRFVSEFGYMSPPNAKTFREYCSQDQWHPQSLVVEGHIKREGGQDRLYRFLSAHHKVTEDYDDFIYKCQVLQGEAISYAVQHWRKEKWHTGGILYWQFNDCWPGSSWSSVDYRKRPKALYYFSKRFFATTLLIMEESEEEFNFWISNDSLRLIDGVVSIVLENIEGMKRKEISVHAIVGANDSTFIVALKKSELRPQDPFSEYLFCRLTVSGESVSEVIVLFVEPKHLNLTPPSLSASLTRTEGNLYQLNISTDILARYVFVDSPNREIYLSDNYFDILPHESHRVEIRSKSGIDLSDLVIRSYAAS